MKTETAYAAAGAPPAGVSGLMLWGVTLADWVLIGTAIYTALMTYVLIRDKFYRPWKEARDERRKLPAARP